MTICYYEEGTCYGTSAGSLTITKYDDVGGVIEGTFSGSVSSGTTKVITAGVIKVKRIANDSWD